MLRVSSGNVFAYLDYLITVDKLLLLLSVYDRSAMAVAGTCANVGLNGETVRIYEEQEVIAAFSGRMETLNYNTKIQYGRENVTHGICISSLVNSEYIFISREQWQEDLYAFLMTTFDYPLLREWIPYLANAAKEKGLLVEADFSVIGAEKELFPYAVLKNAMSNDDLQVLISYGLSNKLIQIAKTEQRPLQFEDMDDYFQKYGHTLVDNLEKQLSPLSPMKERVETLCFHKKKLYPGQAAIVNGAVCCLENKGHAFLVESMGAGKTLQCLGTIEGIFNQRYLEQHPEHTVRDIYLDGTLVEYKCIIMCPSHLVKKWEDSILEEVPYAKTIIINGIGELVKLRRRGNEPTGKEYYILSKDSGKLGYSYAPVPTQIKWRHARIPACKKCGSEFPADLAGPCKCGCREWKLKRTRTAASGLICPECGELLLPADGRRAIDDDTGAIRILQPEDFAGQTTLNTICRCCKTALWMPACEPVDDRIMFNRPKKKVGKWVKISHFSNRARKGRKSVWVMKSRRETYKEKNGISEEEIEEMNGYGPRRYAPARYIKKFLKGYFQIAVFDEVQEYKAGGSAQGLSMHDLVKASDMQIALTGTIASGYAADLFYTLYRLNPGRMAKMGYEYGRKGEQEFVRKYGTVETLYEIEEDGRYNSMSRGRALSSPKCLPGISPLIFTDFLLDTALFLDISDLSNYLPKLHEDIVTVPLEEEVYQEYQRVRTILKEYMKKEEKGKLLMGSFLQFSLSYTDMPYRKGPILSPETGEEVVRPADFQNLFPEGALSNKEKEAVRIVKRELEEKRCCFIYCEYTGGDDPISYRLQEVMQHHCGLNANEVLVLNSGNPPAVKREGWLHQKAHEGAKVIITNAKCVSTGLDFAFQYRGRLYNYPTIIFYQLGYDMIKIWQGGKRHYRLNQYAECRTFYLVSEGTIQLDAIELFASKVVATSAIQGQFSAEGVATMAKGIDARVRLAQAVADKSDKKRQGLKKLIDAINIANNRGKEEEQHELMPNFTELTGLQQVPDIGNPLQELEMTGRDIMDLLGLADPVIEHIEKKEERNGSQDILDLFAAAEAQKTEQEKEFDLLNLIF